MKFPAYKFNPTAPNMSFENIETMQQECEKFLKTSKWTANRFHFYMDNLKRNGEIRYMGYCFSMRNHLKKFLVRQPSSIYAYYAPSKAALRKVLCIGSRTPIMEIPKNAVGW